MYSFSLCLLAQTKGEDALAVEEGENGYWVLGDSQISLSHKPPGDKLM